MHVKNAGSGDNSCCVVYVCVFAQKKNEGKKNKEKKLHGTTYYLQIPDARTQPFVFPVAV